MGLRIPPCRLGKAGEVWVPRHPLGRRAGCIDCWFPRYSTQWGRGEFPPPKAESGQKHYLPAELCGRDFELI